MHARQSEAHCGFGEGLLRSSNLQYVENPTEFMSKQGTCWTPTPYGIINHMVLFQLEKCINMSAAPAGENKIIMACDKLLIFPFVKIPFVKCFFLSS